MSLKRKVTVPVGKSVMLVLLSVYRAGPTHSHGAAYDERTLTVAAGWRPVTVYRTGMVASTFAEFALPRPCPMMPAYSSTARAAPCLSSGGWPAPPAPRLPAPAETLVRCAPIARPPQSR